MHEDVLPPVALPLTAAIHQYSRRHSTPVRIDPGSRDDVRFWAQQLHHWNGRQQWRSSRAAPYVSASDASPRGFGFYLESAPTLSTSTADSESAPTLSDSTADSAAWPQHLRVGAPFSGTYAAGHVDGARSVQLEAAPPLPLHRSTDNSAGDVPLSPSSPRPQSQAASATGFCMDGYLRSQPPRVARIPPSAVYAMPSWSSAPKPSSSSSPPLFPSSVHVHRRRGYSHAMQSAAPTAASMFDPPSLSAAPEAFPQESASVEAVVRAVYAALQRAPAAVRAPQFPSTSALTIPFTGSPSHSPARVSSAVRGSGRAVTPSSTYPTAGEHGEQKSGEEAANPPATTKKRRRTRPEYHRKQYRISYVDDDDDEKEVSVHMRCCAHVCGCETCESSPGPRIVVNGRLLLAQESVGRHEKSKKLHKFCTKDMGCYGLLDV